MNPAEWLDRVAARHPDRPALMAGAETVADDRGFARLAAAVAGGLSALHGISAGDRVALLAKNSTGYIVALYAAPMSHGAGLYSFVHVIAGARHAVPVSGGFDAEEVLDLSDRLGRVSMFAAPTMVRNLVDAARMRKEPGTGIRTVVYGDGGGPMYLADIVEAVEVMGPRFVQIYGQGECPMTITALRREEVADRTHPRWRERLGSVGQAQSVVRLKIAGPDVTEIARGAVGEILVQGQVVMRGYWRNDRASTKTLRDGWLWTGDMGRRTTTAI